MPQQKNGTAGPPSNTGGDEQSRPSITAVFRCSFDTRAGYQLNEHECEEELKGRLDGSIEYKCLPSGLHTVSSDLVYFTHRVRLRTSSNGGTSDRRRRRISPPDRNQDGRLLSSEERNEQWQEEEHTGVSAFLNERTLDGVGRGAMMQAVGVLLRTGDGRMGRAWAYADLLPRLAHELASVKDSDERAKRIAKFWLENKSVSNEGIPPLEQQDEETKGRESYKGMASTQAAGRQRAVSNLTIPHLSSSFSSAERQSIPVAHPARSLPDLLSTFGPLAFPIYRAALNHQRILIVDSPPLEESCHFVYGFSLLATIPQAAGELVIGQTTRLTPLFAVGLSDIDHLQRVARHRRMAESAGRDAEAGEQDDGGFIAVTTDQIIASKDDLYDLVIHLPPRNQQGIRTRFPSLKPSGPSAVPIKASARDLRRWRTLKHQLLDASPIASRPTAVSSTQSSSRRASQLLASSNATPAWQEQLASITQQAEEEVCQPQPWLYLAYDTFLWWASAGEKRRAAVEEEEQLDQTLFRFVEPSSTRPPSQPPRPQPADPSPPEPESESEGSSSDDEADIPLLQRSRSRNTSPGQRKKRPKQAPKPKPTPIQTDVPSGSPQDRPRAAPVELDIIAYFRRTTTLLLGALADALEAADDDAGVLGAEDRAPAQQQGLSSAGTGAGTTLRLRANLLAEMGLDASDPADRRFVAQLAARWFGREGVVVRRSWSEVLLAPMGWVGDVWEGVLGVLNGWFGVGVGEGGERGVLEGLARRRPEGGRVAVCGVRVW